MMLSLLITFRGDEQLERWLHRNFADVRSHGEWFALADQLDCITDSVAQYYWATTGL